MKRFERRAFVVLVVLTLGAMGVALYCLAFGSMAAGKWIATAGLLGTMTGVVQLEVSGFFSRILERFTDEAAFPYGPPSYINREVVDNPDRPFVTWIRNTFYFSPRTGFWFIVVGTFVQVVAVWA